MVATPHKGMYVRWCVVVSYSGILPRRVEFHHSRLPVLWTDPASTRERKGREGGRKEVKRAGNGGEYALYLRSINPGERDSILFQMELHYVQHPSPLGHYDAANTNKESWQCTEGYHYRPLLTSSRVDQLLKH